MGVLDSSYIKALGVKSAGLRKIFLVFQDTLRIRVTTLNSFNNVCAPLSSVPENIQHEISSPSQMSPLSSKRWLNLGDLNKKNPRIHFCFSPGYLMFLPISRLSTGLATEVPEKLRIKIQENPIRSLQTNYYLQGKGFSPVWRLLRWACSRELSTNPFSQKSHLYFLSLSSVCDTFMCLQRLVKVPPQ